MCNLPGSRANNIYSAGCDKLTEVQGGGCGGGGEGGVSMAYLCIQPTSIIFHLMSSTICLFHSVVQDFVQKALFSEIQAIRSGWGNYV